MNAPPCHLITNLDTALPLCGADALLATVCTMNPTLVTCRECQKITRRYSSAGMVSEKVWQAAVLRLLKQHGYTFLYHTFDSRRSPSGFPDIIGVHERPGHPLLAIELKTDTGTLSQAQQAWLDALAGCPGILAEVWRPQDTDVIRALLRREKSTIEI